MGITIAVIAVALFIHRAHVPAPIEAQSASPFAAIPNLTGIWHRKGPLNGKPNAPAVPTNRAAGFEKAFDDAHSVGRYENGRLVITTTQFAFDPRGFHANRWVSGSTLKQMTEGCRRQNRDVAVREHAGRPG